MHPITVIEILTAVAVVFVLGVIAFLLGKRFRKVSMMVIGLVIVVELSFFAIRPFWIDYHVEIKKEQLNSYLDSKYPTEQWSISRQEGRQYNPYTLEVEFANEPGWTYLYHVKDAEDIYQVGYGVPDGLEHNNGLHVEDHQEVD
ncbi:hypothetical protein LCL95_01210 [Bacillus timonensis]|nr:hypothetical protein [Bacillus timonensis]